MRFSVTVIQTLKIPHRNSVYRTLGITSLPTCPWSALYLCLHRKAVRSAEDAKQPVQHPLLDKVQQCSSKPDAAADLFLGVQGQTDKSGEDMNQPIPRPLLEKMRQCSSKPDGAANLFLFVQGRAVSSAEEANQPVQPPLLDKVRQCSINPDAAADLFVKMMHLTLLVA